MLDLYRSYCHPISHVRIAFCYIVTYPIAYRISHFYLSWMYVMDVCDLIPSCLHVQLTVDTSHEDVSIHSLSIHSGIPVAYCALYPMWTSQERSLTTYEPHLVYHLLQIPCGIIQRKSTTVYVLKANSIACRRTVGDAVDHFMVRL